MLLSQPHGGLGGLPTFSTLTMTALWISLPARWELQNVQAALNVIITVLSTLGVFVFVRSCWHRAAKRVAHDDDVPLPALLSLNTLGEAIDVVFLLKGKLLSSRYLSVLAQCVVVICLSSTALLAGVIARYSTKRGHIVSQDDVAGSLVTRQHNSMGLASVEWNLTYDRLDEADFPNDQLLDFLPDNNVDWSYDPAQWNNSWSIECEQTPKRSIDMYDSGNCTEYRYELPNLDQIISYDDWDGYRHSPGGFYNTRQNIKDALMFIYGWKSWDFEEACETNRSMTFKLASLHMHNVPRDQNDTDCLYRKGDIGESYYTAITCDLRRKDQVPDACHVAFPDVDGNNGVASAYTDYYLARFIQESTSNSPISVITPPELLRFYQVYTVVKDLQYRQPITRSLSVNVRVVQLSTVFLTIALLLALLISLGLLIYAFFVVRHHDIVENTPQSKLDWMLQSIQTEDRPLTDNKGRLRRSVTVEDTQGLVGMPSVRRKRREFEKAKFGGKATSTWFLRESPGLSTEGMSTEFGGSPSPRVEVEIGTGSGLGKSMASVSGGYFGYEPVGGLGVQMQSEKRPML